MLVSSVILLEGEGTCGSVEAQTGQGWDCQSHGGGLRGSGCPQPPLQPEGQCSRLVALTGEPRSGPWRPVDWTPEPSAVPAAVSTEHTLPGRLWIGRDVLMVVGVL